MITPDLYPSPGAVVSLTPAAGQLSVTLEDDSHFEFDIIGMAVTVDRWGMREPDGFTYDTTVEPVVITPDGHTFTLGELRRRFTGRPKFKVEVYR